MKKPSNYLLASLGLVMAISSCKTNQGGEKIKAIDVANIDTSVRPQDDFYAYANGLWLKNNPIPSTETRWGAFSILQDQTNKKLKVLLDESAANTAAEKGSNEQKVGDFYASGMDSLAIEKAGLTPLKDELAKIQAIQNTNDLLNEVAQLQKKGVGALFSFYVYQDMKISTAYIPYADQGGLSLPDRDYYTNTDARSEEIRKQYRIHLEKMFVMMGDDQATAQANAATIIRLETELAKASMTRVEMRDPYATYNKMSIADANKITKSINWNTVISKAGLSNVNEMIVSQPKFFTALDNMLSAEKIDAWKTYLRWHLVSGFAGNLNQSFVAESFAFNGTVMNGAKQMRPRWKRVLGDINGGLGEALGSVYVKRYFPEEAKKRCLEMVNNMQVVYRERIEKLDWMGDSTKKQAIEKLEVFIKKIGYPDKFKDYSKLTISRDSYVQNIIAANEFAFEEMINKYGKPVDKTEWGMTPHTINAYYNPNINEIVFPAGILQFPFFDPSVDDAINYGGIGAVIGHEMTHGFDDQGCQFDKDGNLKNWWTEQDNNKFKAKTKMLVDQYSAYTVLNNVHVNGELTLGENIADVGGINIAYDAFKRTAQGKSSEKIDGFTADQRFFLSWAQVWRQNITDENLNQRIVTDPHSPGKYRTNGPLTNMPEFYEAFGIKKGDKMYRPTAERVKVW